MLLTVREYLREDNQEETELLEEGDWRDIAMNEEKKDDIIEVESHIEDGMKPRQMAAWVTKKAEKVDHVPKILFIGKFLENKR